MAVDTAIWRTNARSHRTRLWVRIVLDIAVVGAALLGLRHALFLLISLLIVAFQICDPLNPIGERLAFGRLLLRTCRNF